LRSSQRATQRLTQAWQRVPPPPPGNVPGWEALLALASGCDREKTGDTDQLGPHCLEHYLHPLNTTRLRTEVKRSARVPLACFKNRVGPIDRAKGGKNVPNAGAERVSWRQGSRLRLPLASDICNLRCTASKNLRDHTSSIQERAEAVWSVQ